MGNISETKSSDVTEIFSIHNQMKKEKRLAEKQESIKSDIISVEDYGEEYDFETLKELGNVETDKNYGIMPIGVFHHIMMFLQPNDLFQVFQVCKLFHKIAKTQVFWKNYTQNFFNVQQVKDGDWKKTFYKQHYVNKLFEKEYELHPTGFGKNISKLKITNIGMTNVGKTSFLRKFIQGDFDDKEEETLGASYSTKDIHNKKMKNSVTIDLWDTSGSERFRNIIPMYLRQSNYVFIFFSLNDKESCEFVVKYHKYSKFDENVANDKCKVVLIGSKCDLKREVTEKQINQLKEQIKPGFYVETSAKKGINCKLPFYMILNDFYKNFYDESSSVDDIKV